MSVCIAGCQYIPSVEYFAHWLHNSNFRIEACEHFQKRSWRNKAAILSPGDPLHLSVPLIKGKNQQMQIQDVEISYLEKWNRIHLASIQTAYGKTAFFEEIEPELKKIYLSAPRTLWQLNLNMIDFIISLMQGTWKYELTKVYMTTLEDGQLDLRSGIGAGISSLSTGSMPEYQQVHRFGKTHLSNLSILDALCHLGPETTNYVFHYANRLYANELCE